ncbi:MAG: methyltransferase [Pirellulales bacterium]
MSEVWTVGKLLQWTTDYLKKQGADSPRLDAEVLLAHCRKCPRIALYTAFEDVATDDLRNTFRDLVKKRAEGMPVAYLVGERVLLAQIRRLARRADPAPETEFLILRGIDILKERGEPADVVDVGTGSGCIAITVAKQNKTARLTAIDQSPAALAVAEQRRQARHDRANRVRRGGFALWVSGRADLGFDPQQSAVRLGARIRRARKNGERLRTRAPAWSAARPARN